MAEREKYPLNPSGDVSNLSASPQIWICNSMGSRRNGSNVVAAIVVMDWNESFRLLLRRQSWRCGVMSICMCLESGDLWLTRGKHHGGNCLHDATSRMQSKTHTRVQASLVEQKLLFPKLSALYNSSWT